jgi:hypothetical protein
MLILKGLAIVFVVLLALVILNAILAEHPQSWHHDGDI